MYAESLLERFRAVEALATRGAPGERDNAKRVVIKMETDYPNIRYWAFPPPPQPETTDWYDSPRARQAGNDAFERVRRAATGAFSWMSEVASEIAATKLARDTADDVCDLQVKWLPSGKWQMALRFNHDDLAWVTQNLTPFQKQEFVRHIMGMLEQELTDVLNEG